MAWQSTLPAVIDGLVSLLSAQPDLSGLVRDGPELRDAADLEAVFVGYTGSDEDVGADGSLSRSGLAVEPDREQYAVHCAVAVLNGSSDITAARSRAYELFAAVGEAVTTDHTLSGLVLHAELGGWSLMQSQTPDGAYASLTFDVDIDAFTNL